jgi:hypothetical protein
MKSATSSSTGKTMITVADMRKPYRGSTRSLVLALDVGTTFSGVSYAILEPGEVPKIHGVTRSVVLWKTPSSKNGNLTLSIFFLNADFQGKNMLQATQRSRRCCGMTVMDACVPLARRPNARR